MPVVPSLPTSALVWLAIFAGGGLGACLRVAIGIAIDARVASTAASAGTAGSAAAAGFPWGLLAVNALGCFAIGAITTFSDERVAFGPALRAFAIAGLLGGFTTFSSFGLDTMRLFAEGRPGFAAANVVASIALALAGVAAGGALARALG